MVIYIVHWNDIKDKIKVKKYVEYVDRIKEVVESFPEVEEAYVYGSFARELLKEIYPEVVYAGRRFRTDSDIDVYVVCKEEYGKGGWCFEKIMLRLEEKLPELNGHKIEWNTAMVQVVKSTPFKIMIKPQEISPLIRFLLK